MGVRVCERRKLRVNIGKRKVIRCSTYVKVDRMHVRLSGEPLDLVTRSGLFLIPGVASGIGCMMLNGCGTQNE